MTFLSPAGFWLSLLLPLVVLLYLLKLRRTEVLVSSTFLWKKALEDMHANAPFQKLVKNLLLYAQLLALSALVFALARPLLAGGLSSGRSIAILIDTSASMQATDVKPSRIEVAKAEALKLVEGMAGRDEAMILTFDVRPRIVVPMTREKAPLRDALKSVSASDAPGSIREALLIASSILRSAREPALLILSDGRCRGLDVPVDERIDVRYLKIGERGRNAGITALDCRPSEDGSGRQQVFVETRAAGELKRGTLSLYRDGGLVDARKVAWEGGRPGTAVFDLACTSETRLKVQLDVGKEADDLAVDDTAFAVLAERPRRRILLVSDGNYFLERLLNLEKRSDLFTVAPKEYKPGDWSLVVFDRWAPERLGPGRYLFVGALPPLEGFKTLGVAEHPMVLDWKRGHPLMRFANFNGLQIRKSPRWEIPDWATPLLESNEGPLVVMAERGPVKAAAVAFDLFDSDWPFRLSFPVFVSNAVRTLGSEGLGEDRSLRPGEAFTWRTEGKAEALSVRRPDGTEASVPFHGEETAVFAGTARAGFYEADDGKAKRAYAVSLRSAEESDTTPVEANAFTLSGKKVAAAGGSLDQRELWAWFAVAALALLCLEWAMYHRRWL